MCFSASESLITAEEVGLYLPLVLCIGTVLSMGFGPPVVANSVLLVSNEFILYSLPYFILNHVNMLKSVPVLIFSESESDPLILSMNLIQIRSR